MRETRLITHYGMSKGKCLGVEELLHTPSTWYVCELKWTTFQQVLGNMRCRQNVWARSNTDQIVMKQEVGVAIAWENPVPVKSIKLNSYVH